MRFFRCNHHAVIQACISTSGKAPSDTPKEELIANTVDAAREKHVPVIAREGNTVTVTVGSVLHPHDRRALYSVYCSGNGAGTAG